MRYTYTIKDLGNGTVSVRENTPEQNIVFTGTVVEANAWIDLQNKALWV